FFQAEDGIRDFHVTGVQTCALPISRVRPSRPGFAGPLRMTDLLAAIDATGNDLEGPAITLQPVIADLLDALRSMPACRLAGMSRSEERRVGEEGRERGVAHQ